LAGEQRAIVVRAEFAVAGEQRATVGRAEFAVAVEQRPARAAARLRPAGAPLEPRPAPGTEISAALAFHPGAAPLRALLAGEPEIVGDATGFSGGTIEDALEATAHALAANPWLDEWPVALAAATPDITAGDWRLNADGSLPLGGPSRAVWRLLALSGGRPISVFGLWNGARLAPLAASDGARVVAL
jgi:hypothetical protein